MAGIKLQTLPILVDSGGVVICGHTRLRAARQLKHEEAPVIVLGRLIEGQKGADAAASRPCGGSK